MSFETLIRVSALFIHVMAYTKSERYTLPMDDSNNTVRIPAVVQEEEHVAYNDEVEVTLYPSGNSDVKSVTFTAFLTANNCITIPKKVRQGFGADELTLSFEATGRHWSPEIDSTSRKAVYESAHPEQTKLKSVSDIVSADD
jgi:hypothetical protein